MGCKMKYLAGALASACVLVLASAASADTIIDHTNVVAYTGNHSTNYFGGSSQGDVIGSGFDTSKVDITASSATNTITLKFYTQFDGDELTAKYADVFLQPSNADGSPSSWGFGLSLGYQSKGPGLYDLDGPSDYKTSQQIWTSKTDYTYGGLYVKPEGGTAVVPTRIIGGDKLCDWKVVVDKDHVSGNNYTLTITLTADDADTFKQLGGSQYLDLLWGTGDCANDTIYAQYQTPPVKTPEPASIVLFAGGLLALRRRRK